MMFTAPQARLVNHLPSLTRFIARWDDPSNAENDQQVRLALSKFGNIKQSSASDERTGQACSPHQSQFPACIEAGIRPLTLLLVRRFGLITYTSCEGHDYGAMGLPSVERHLGILPRSATEARRVALLLPYLCSERVTEQRGVKPMWIKQWLHDDERKAEVYDLYFVKRSDLSWRDYFLQVGAASRSIEERLSAL
jgi:hypothetical protein